ncbi:MAG: integrin alpha [Phycisphaerales bacterium]
MRQTTRIIALTPALIIASHINAGTLPIPGYTVYHDPDAISPGIVSCVGDVNNDGANDFGFGLAGDTTNGNGAGAAFIYSGVDGSLLYSYYGNPSEALGRAVSGAGDVNNDGYDDFIIGAPNAGSPSIHEGQAIVYSGFDGSVLHELHGNMTTLVNFGTAASGIGDINNDNHDDFIIGSFSSDTAVVFSGIDGSVIYTLVGTPNDKLGVSMSGLGDINGDTTPDFVIGAPERTLPGAFKAGVAIVYSGADASIIYTFTADAARDSLGGSVDNAGDVNNDGTNDIIVGASQAIGLEEPANGYARVYSGADGSILYTLQESGQTISGGGRYGGWVRGAGDVDNDGFDDVMVSGTGYRIFGTFGLLRVYSGADGSTIYTLASYLEPYIPGRGLDSLGDVNNDGYPDIAFSRYDNAVQVFFTGVAGFDTVCPRGDVSGPSGTPDGFVDIEDINAILSAWGSNVGIGSPLDIAQDDGFIDADDLNLVLADWALGCF